MIKMWRRILLSPYCGGTRRFCQIVLNEEGSKLKPDSTGNIQKNDNRIVRGEPGEVRHGFIPEEWFSSFYDKTGVTGFYTFGVTTGTYLISKEIYVLEHNYYGGLSMALLCMYATKKVGPTIANMLDKEIDEYEDSWNKLREVQIINYEDSILHEEERQFSMDGQMLLMEARREQVHLQLEAEYRKRLMHVYETVKDYLDFHVKTEAKKRMFLQRNMIDWVLRKVHEALTPEFLDKYLDDCIEQLPNVMQKFDDSEK